MTLEEISVKEAAEMLRVSEKTVYRWVRQGLVPNFTVQGQYRFNREELQDWARYKNLSGGATARKPAQEEESVNLFRAVSRGGIHYKIEGESVSDIFREVVNYLPLGAGGPALRESLYTTLMERESLVTTAIGQGFALPHPRHPRDWGLGESAVGIFFLEKPADFQAVDGQPVQVLFALLCTSIKGHLKMLQQVSHLLKNPDIQEFLYQVPSRKILLERIMAMFPPPSDN